MFSFTVFFHLYILQYAVNAVPGINLPNVCTAPPGHGKAFCHEHCELLESQAPNVPTGLRDFLKYCGTRAILLVGIILLCYLCRQYSC